MDWRTKFVFDNVTSAILSILLVVSIYMYNPIQWDSLWDLWTGTDTYMHGLVVPFLVGILFKTIPAPSFKTSTNHAVWLIWLLAYMIADASMMSTAIQMMLVAIVPTYLIATYGLKWSWHYRVPLCLWLLMTPVGDFAIPTLQTWTADISVFLLRLSDVPVIRNGWYLSIQNADFRVAEACSGLNFLISTFTLSVFFAFMYMKKAYKRIIFIMLGATVPIIANGIRVFLIIMVAHWGDVEAATGFDHMVYGWVFFVIVLTILLLIGIRMRDVSYVEDASENKSLFIWSKLTPAKSLAPVVIFSILWIFNPPVTPNLEPQVGKIQEIGLSIPGARVSKMKPNQWLLEIPTETFTERMIGFSSTWFDEKKWTLKGQTESSDQEGYPVVRYYLVSLDGQSITMEVSFGVNGLWYSNPKEFKIAQTLSRLLRKDMGSKSRVTLINQK